MWHVANQTPYKADGTWGRDRDGVHEWIVAVTGTFDIRSDGTAALADEQRNPLIAAEYQGEDGQSSLRYDADLVALKPTTDVLLNGTAYAPQGHPTTDFLVSLKIGSIDKTLRVRGNREWQGPTGAGPSKAQAVTEVSIAYERAYGGYDHVDPDPAQHRIDLRNPIGCGVAARLSRRVGEPVPNFEYPAGDLEKAGPAGFGAIDVFWSPRREAAGTYDKNWQDKRLPLLPIDWDPRCLQCAPVDQQTATYLRGGEEVELVNLTRDGLLRFALPKVHLVFTTYICGRSEEHRARLTTVTIEPDFPRVIMTWLTALPCRRDVDDLDLTVVREKQFLA